MNGNIVSIDKVKKELEEENDELKEWCFNTRYDSIGMWKSSANSIKQYRSLMNWASSLNHVRQNAKDKFAEYKNADAFLVATAMNDSSLCLVTHEVSAINSKKEIKIPDVCNAYQVKHISFLEMLRRLNITI
ncbi:MAG: hypothetical protein Kapaf2KO_07430 [Candidatus Kapaibacteriales bacterium]